MRSRDGLIDVLRSVNGNGLYWDGVKTWAESKMVIAACHRFAARLEGNADKIILQRDLDIPSACTAHTRELLTEALHYIKKDAQS